MASRRSSLHLSKDKDPSSESSSTKKTPGAQPSPTARPTSTTKASTTPVPVPCLPKITTQFNSQSAKSQPAQPVAGVGIHVPNSSNPHDTTRVNLETSAMPGSAAEAPRLDKTSSSYQTSNGLLSKNAPFEPQGFPDVPGRGSMEFVERLMENLRKVSQRNDAS